MGINFTKNPHIWLHFKILVWQQQCPDEFFPNLGKFVFSSSPLENWKSLSIPLYCIKIKQIRNRLCLLLCVSVCVFFQTVISTCLNKEKKVLLTNYEYLHIIINLFLWCNFIESPHQISLTTVFQKVSSFQHQPKIDKRRKHQFVLVSHVVSRGFRKKDFQGVIYY